MGRWKGRGGVGGGVLCGRFGGFSPACWSGRRAARAVSSFWWLGVWQTSGACSGGGGCTVAVLLLFCEDG